MIKVTEILDSYGACPFQLTAKTECGNMIYLRYRSGRLRVGFLHNGQNYPDDFFFVSKIGDDLDGCADNELFRKALSVIVEFPPDFTFDSVNDINSYENREEQGQHWKQFLEDTK